MSLIDGLPLGSDNASAFCTLGGRAVAAKAAPPAAAAHPNKRRRVMMGENDILSVTGHPFSSIQASRDRTSQFETRTNKLVTRLLCIPSVTPRHPRMTGCAKPSALRCLLPDSWGTRRLCRGETPHAGHCDRFGPSCRGMDSSVGMRHSQTR